MAPDPGRKVSGGGLGSGDVPVVAPGSSQFHFFIAVTPALALRGIWSQCRSCEEDERRLDISREQADGDISSFDKRYFLTALFHCV